MYTRWNARVFVFCCLAAGLFIRGEVSGQTKQSGNNCEPPAPVRQALREVSDDEETTVGFVERRARDLARLRSLLKQYPNDLFIQQSYQDTVRASLIDAQPLIDEYSSRLALNPDDSLYLYLYGRLLIGRKTGEAKTYMERALQRSPDFPWPHLGLVEIYRTPQFDNKKERQSHLNAFMSACPAYLQAYDYLREADDRALLLAGAQRLRALLESSGAIKDASSYSTLWDLEFQGSPPTQHDSLRSRVESDLRLLRRSEATDTDKKPLLLTLRAGYRLLGKGEQARQVEDDFIRLFPQTDTAMQLSQGRWREAHPPPDDTATPEQVRAYNVALMNAADEWTRQWPHTFFPWLDRVGAISQLGDVPVAEVERAADSLLRAAVENAGSYRTTPPVPMLVAELYLKYNVRLGRIPELARDGLREMEKQAKRDEQAEQISSEMLKYARQSRQFLFWRGLVVMADAYLRLKQPQDARRVLEEMSANLMRQRPDAAASPEERENHDYFQSTYWEWQARLAEAENQKLEALVYYEQALATRPAQGDKSASVEREQMLRKARQLWGELGGTNEGWEHWAKRDAANGVETHAQLTAGGEQNETPLPDFALTDISGQTWRLEQLRGKVVFINIWATWCKPCQQELPLVQQLHEVLKTRSDVVLLTLNVDTEVGLVKPFMQAKGFTFPALLAQEYVQRFRPNAIIPRIWVVSPKGLLHTEQVGFGSESKTWLTRAQEMIQSAGAKH